MADETKKATKPTPAPKKQDDDAVGKVYDSQLMRRLIKYLGPYKLQAGLSCAAILIKSACDVSGPAFVAIALDTYFAPTGAHTSFRRRDPARGALPRRARPTLRARVSADLHDAVDRPEDHVRSAEPDLPPHPDDAHRLFRPQSG